MSPPVMPPPGRTRRGVLASAIGLVTALGGCGFRPLYAPDSADGTSATGVELETIYVALIGERTGQLMRQALQRRLEGTGEGRAKRYELTASFGIAGEGIGIQRDNSSTRIRFVGTSQWTLRDLTPQRTVLTSGVSRSLDGLNVLNQEFFAADLETETIQRRLAELLADQVVQQIAIYMLQKRVAPAAT